MLGRILMSSALIAVGLGFSGCGDSKSDDMMDDTPKKKVMVEKAPMYEVTVTNLTVGQPMAPAVAVLHNSNYKMYTLGTQASVALETLAEGGDNSVLITEAEATTDVNAVVSYKELLKPGKTLTVTLEGDDEYLTFAGMLVNTNDGFVGLNSYHIKHLKMDESEVLMLSTYDAGTEANSESAATVPAQMGEGFNAARDDMNGVIRVHAGVVTSDALSSSALDESARFDNPTAKVMIKRIH